MSKAIIVQPGGGFDRVVLGEIEAPKPLAGEITVRLRASSLNYHDYAVVSGMWGPTVPRIPMSDGAGEVVAVSLDESSRVDARPACGWNAACVFDPGCMFSRGDKAFAGIEKCARRT